MKINKVKTASDFYQSDKFNSYFFKEYNAFYKEDRRLFQNIKLSTLLGKFTEQDLLEIVGLNDYIINTEKEITTKGNFFLLDDKLFFQFQEHNSPIFKVGIKYFNKEYNQLEIDSIDGLLFGVNSNYQSLWLDKYESDVYSFVISRLHSRSVVYNKIEFLKSLFKCSWVNKDMLRKVLFDINETIGFSSEKVLLRSGKHKERICPKKVMIHNSSGGSNLASFPWKKQFPEEYSKSKLFIQGGDSGIVFSSDKNYKTAFVEVFPNNIKNKDGVIFSSFIRGEGSTLFEAEEKAFKKLIKIKSCIDHDRVRGSREDGAATCQKCGVFNSKALQPLTNCIVCKKPSKDFSNGEDFYCLKHYLLLNSNEILSVKDKYMLRDIGYYKNRINDSFIRKIKNKQLKPHEIKYEFKIHTMHYKDSPLSMSSININLFFRYPKFKHFVTKMLIKRGKISANNISDNYSDDYKLIKDISVRMIKSSILFEKESSIISIFNQFFKE